MMHSNNKFARCALGLQVKETLASLRRHCTTIALSDEVRYGTAPSEDFRSSRQTTETELRFCTAFHGRQGQISSIVSGVDSAPRQADAVACKPEL